MNLTTNIATGPDCSLSNSRLTSVFLLLASLVIACYFTFLNPVPDYYPDQQNDPFEYLILAKAIQRDGEFPTKHWQPGFPALLALGTHWFGLDFARLKLCMVLLTFILAGSCYLYFQALMPWFLAAWLALMVTVVPSLFEYSHKLMSEIPCVTFCMLTLALAEWSARKEVSSRPVLWTFALLLSCVGAAAVLIRGNALALLPGLLFLTRQKDPSTRIAWNWPVIACIVCSATAFGLWTYRNHQVEYSGVHNVTYIEEVRAQDMKELWHAGGLKEGVRLATVRDFTDRAKRNLVWYHVYNIADCLVPGSGVLREISVPILGFLIAVLLCLPILIGLPSLWRQSPAGAVFLLGSLVLILVYPTGGSRRMLIPSIPLIVLAGYLGLRRILNGTASGWIVAMVCVGLVQCAFQGQRQSNKPYSFPEFADFVAVLRVVDAHSQDHDTAIVSQYPQVVSALTDLTPMNLDQALSDLKKGTASRILIIEAGGFRPLENLDNHFSAQLIAERATTRAWDVTRKGS